MERTVVLLVRLVAVLNNTLSSHRIQLCLAGLLNRVFNLFVLRRLRFGRIRALWRTRTIVGVFCRHV